MKKTIPVKGLTLILLCLSTLLLISSAVQQAHAASSNTDMVGLVPHYYQEGDTCGLYNLLQVFHWFGLLDISVDDLADYIGHREGPHYLEELDDAFAHFMPPGSYHDYGGNDNAEDAKNVVKGHINIGIPVICCIHAPGSGWTAGFANHYVTIVGYDDSLFGGEGGWYVHDTSTWIGPDWENWDVPVRYSEFDEWWDVWWTATPGSNDNRGAVVAKMAQGDGAFCGPYVKVNTVGSPWLDGYVYDNDPVAHLEIHLTNSGDDISVYQASESQGTDGVTIEVSSGEITMLSTQDFTRYESLDTGQSNDAPYSGPIQPTQNLRLVYENSLNPGATLSATFDVHALWPGPVSLTYWGYLTDDNSWVREKKIWLNDDSSRSGEGVDTVLPERYCIKSGVSTSFSIRDDDTTAPDLSNLASFFGYPIVSPSPVYDNIHSPIEFATIFWDAHSGISECGFTYRWGSGEWQTCAVTTTNTLPNGITLPEGGVVASAVIPRSEWIGHVGDSCQYAWYAVDGDNDRTGDGSRADSSVYSIEILDDDPDPPILFDPTSSGDILESDPNDYMLKISAWDSSGWCSVYFSYCFSGDAYWSTGNLGESGIVPYEYEFHIPRSIWINHLNEEIYWQVSALDSDDDRVGDGLWAYSPGDYYGGKIISVNDASAPNITDVSQTPTENNVLPTDEVRVNATVTDDISGVKQVTLDYTNGNGTWITVNMTNLVGTVWNVTIPAFAYGTNVTYRIIAEDNVGNTITTEDLGYEYQYIVIPEFPPWTSILLVFIMLSVVIAIYKRRLLKTPNH